MEFDVLVLKKNKNFVGQQFKLSKRNWEKNGTVLHENLYHNAHSVFPSFPDTLLYLMNLLLLRMMRVLLLLFVVCLQHTFPPGLVTRSQNRKQDTKMLHYQSWCFLVTYDKFLKKSEGLI